jgi:hypothetical protein
MITHCCSTSVANIWAQFTVRIRIDVYIFFCIIGRGELVLDTQRNVPLLF